MSGISVVAQGQWFQPLSLRKASLRQKFCSFFGIINVATHLWIVSRRACRYYSFSWQVSIAQDVFNNGFSINRIVQRPPQQIVVGVGLAVEVEPQPINFHNWFANEKVFIFWVCSNSRQFLEGENIQIINFAFSICGQGLGFVFITYNVYPREMGFAAVVFFISKQEQTFRLVFF